MHNNNDKSLTQIETNGVEQIPDHERTAGPGDLFRLILRAGAGRIEDEAVEGVELLEGERAAEQVAALGSDALQAGRLTEAAVERGNRSGVALHRMDLGFLRQTQGETAAAGEEVRDLLCAGEMTEHEIGHGLLGKGGCLQEGA